MNKRFDNMDADESIFFARELEFRKSKTYDIKYGELKARQLIPVSSEAGPGADSITYEQYDMVGIAKVIASYADDLPRADVKGKQFNAPIRSLGASYGYSLQEIRAARYAGKPLEQRKANAAKRAIMQKENTIAFLGDAKSGMMGLINNANISMVTVPANGTGTVTTNWTGKTAAQILADLNAIANFSMANTFGVEMPDTLLLPLAQYNMIATTPWSNTGDGRTLLDLFLAKSPYIKNVTWVNELKGAGAGGTDRAIAYRRDPDALTLEIPQDFEQLEVQPRGLEFVVPCHERIAGVLVYYPLSVVYADGI